MKTDTKINYLFILAFAGLIVGALIFSSCTKNDYNTEKINSVSAKKDSINTTDKKPGRDTITAGKPGTYILHDIDGNIYDSVIIGTQVWMAENLKTTKYNDGMAIPLITDSITWTTSTTPAYCWYNNDTVKKNPYGALYNWYVVGTGKLCPGGWHVPTIDDWTILNNYVVDNSHKYADGTNDAAQSIASQSGWKVPQDSYMGHGTTVSPSPSSVGINQLHNNSTGFNAFPSGNRGWDGLFSGLSQMTVWWSSSGGEDPFSIFITYEDYTIVSMINHNITKSEGSGPKTGGSSIRCIKN